MRSVGAFQIGATLSVQNERAQNIASDEPLPCSNRNAATFNANALHIQNTIFLFGPVSVDRFHLSGLNVCVCITYVCALVVLFSTIYEYAVLSSSISFVLFASPPRKQNANVAAELQEKLDSHTRHHKIENSFEKILFNLFSFIL